MDQIRDIADPWILLISRENNKIPWDFPEFPEKIEFPEFSSFPWVFQVVDTMLT